MPSPPKPAFRFTILLLILGAGAIVLSLLHAIPPDISSFLNPPVAHPRAVSPLFDPSLAAQLLDDPKRAAWQQPGRIVQALKLHPGDVVADVGAGSGYLMPYLSCAVGPEGGVYAEEIQPEYLPTLRRRAQAHKNVQVVLGTAANPRLPRGGIDCFVLLTVYHEVENPVAFLRTLRACARRGTRLAIIDFDADRKGTPPAPDGHEIAEATVIAEAKKAGWIVSERHDFISSQFFLVFRPL
jgi:predicted methyltransferase